MKALSIKQPWANLIASGAKTIETRKWKTNYRGQILLCTSLKPEIEPFGKAIAIAELFHVEKMVEEHEHAAMTKVYDRAYSWFLRDIINIEPINIKGQLSIYNVDIDWNGIKFLN